MPPSDAQSGGISQASASPQVESQLESGGAPGFSASLQSEPRYGSGGVSEPSAFTPSSSRYNDGRAYNPSAVSQSESHAQRSPAFDSSTASHSDPQIDNGGTIHDLVTRGEPSLGGARQEDLPSSATQGAGDYAQRMEGGFSGSAVGGESSYTGPPAHHRKESIPTTAYPSGRMQDTTPISPPVGGTRAPPGTASTTAGQYAEPTPRDTAELKYEDRQGDGHFGRDTAMGAGIVGAGAVGEHEYSRPEADQVGTERRGAAESDIDRRKREDKEAAAAMSELAGGAGLGLGTTDAARTHVRHELDSQRNIQDPLNDSEGRALGGPGLGAGVKDAARQYREEEIGKQRGMADPAPGQYSGSGLGSGLQEAGAAYSARELERERALKGTGEHSITKEQADDLRTRRGVVGEDAKPAGTEEHHHTQHKEKKPGLLGRIFKRRKNQDTGESEEYSSDEEYDANKHHHYHPTTTGAATAAGTSGVAEAAATHEASYTAPEDFQRPSYNPFKSADNDPLPQPTDAAGLR